MIETCQARRKGAVYEVEIPSIVTDLGGFSCNDLLNSTYPTVLQPDLDPSGVVLGPSEDVLHDASRQLSCPLVPLQDDQDLGALFDVAPDPPVGSHGPPISTLAPL